MQGNVSLYIFLIGHGGVDGIGGVLGIWCVVGHVGDSQQVTQRNSVLQRVRW